MDKKYSKIESELDDLQQQAHDEGYKEGYEQGKKDGYEEAVPN